jgi:hypothetical protein
VFPLQASGIFGSELDTPEPDCFITDSNSTLGEEIFDISIAEIEPVVQPDCVTDDIWWESAHNYRRGAPRLFAEDTIAL